MLRRPSSRGSPAFAMTVSDAGTPRFACPDSGVCAQPRLEWVADTAAAGRSGQWRRLRRSCCRRNQPS
jgi:hypothetical protein